MLPFIISLSLPTDSTGQEISILLKLAGLVEQGNMNGEMARQNILRSARRIT
jgi:hypothetical protein